ncbi:hypothetical protein LTS18_002046, partial [Coniosporium uncinatum]
FVQNGSYLRFTSSIPSSKMSVRPTRSILDATCTGLSWVHTLKWMTTRDEQWRASSRPGSSLSLSLW